MGKWCGRGRAGSEFVLSVLPSEEAARVLPQWLLFGRVRQLDGVTSGRSEEATGKMTVRGG